jgi:hypothetical protein
MTRILFTAGLLLWAGGTLHAATLTFSDRSDWQNVVSGLSNFNGGNLAVGSALGNYTSAGLTTTELQIVGIVENTFGTYYELTQANPNSSQPWYEWNSGTIIRSADKATAQAVVYLRIVFAAPVSAFGFNFGVGGYSGIPGNVTVAAQGMNSVNLTTLQQPNWSFYGLASDTQTFSQVDIFINDWNRYVVLDDIATANYSPAPPPPPPPPTNDVPEPGTALQLLIGSGLILFARRRLGSASY